MGHIVHGDLIVDPARRGGVDRFTVRNGCRRTDLVGDGHDASGPVLNELRRSRDPRPAGR